MRSVLTTTRRRVIVAMAALGVLAPAAAAEGATYWTIRPDVRDPLLWVGLANGLGPAGLVEPVLAVPTGTLDQHWSFRKSKHGYTIANRQSGQCLGGGPGTARIPGRVDLFDCAYIGSTGSRYNFHRPGSPQPLRTLSSGVRQIRWSFREDGEEIRGRCLAVRYSFFQPGGNLVQQSCNRGQTANQRFRLSSFVEP